MRAELRPVKAAADGAPPPPRFAHAAVAVAEPAGVAVVGGVNQAEDLSDVHVWTV